MSRAHASGTRPCLPKPPTVDSLVQQQQEFVHGVPHLGLCEVQQRHHLEVELAQEVGEFVHVHHGSLELRVVLVRQISDQQGHFVSRWNEVETQQLHAGRTKGFFHKLEYICLSELSWKHMIAYDLLLVTECNLG